MNRLTIFCEHSSEQSIQRLETVKKFASEKHLKWLKPEDLDAFFNDKLGGNYALLTFDDGQEYKYPEIAIWLKSNNIRAISFLIPLHWGFHSLYTNFDYYITNRDVFEVGSHSLTHTMVVDTPEYDGISVTSPRLIYYGTKDQKVSYSYGLLAHEYNVIKKRKETEAEFDRRLNMEISFSKEWIERATGNECRYFAFPYGVFDSNSVSRVWNAGYKMAFTMNRTDNSRFTIPRLDTAILNCGLKNNIIGDVVVVSSDRYSQNEIDMKRGIYK